MLFMEANRRRHRDCFTTVRRDRPADGPMEGASRRAGSATLIILPPRAPDIYACTAVRLNRFASVVSLKTAFVMKLMMRALSGFPGGRWLHTGHSCSE